MDGINARSSAQEVRALTGYDRTEWNYFHKVAYAKAREFVIANRDSLTTWGDVPYGQRRAMLEDLNQHLEEQRVHPVSDEVFHWKCCQMMPKMIKEMKKADALQEEQKYDASGPGSEVGDVEGLPAGNGVKDSTKTGAPASVPSPEPSMCHSVGTAPIPGVGLAGMVDTVEKCARTDDNRQRSDVTPKTSNVPLSETSPSPPLTLPPIQQGGTSVDDRGESEKVELKGIKDLLRSADEQTRPPPARSSIHNLLSR